MNTAVILAAGMGIRLSPIVGIRPKGLLKIGDYPLLGRSINMLKKHGIKKIFIVTGHQSEMLMSELEDFSSNIETHYCFNENYEQSGSMHSLFMLQDILKEDFLLLESDLLFEEEALISILNEQNNDVLLISGKTNSGDEVWIYGKKNSGKESLGLIKKINKKIYKELETIGELTGISKISYELFRKMCDHYRPRFSGRRGRLSLLSSHGRRLLCRGGHKRWRCSLWKIWSPGTGHNGNHRFKVSQL